MVSSTSSSYASLLVLGCFISLLLSTTMMTTTSAFVVVVPKYHYYCSSTISNTLVVLHQSTTTSTATNTNVEAEEATTTRELDPKEAEKFKIVTCMSTSCMKKRQVLGLNELHTYTQFYARINNSKEDDDVETNSSDDNNTQCPALQSIQLEEGPCLGACKFGPCVAIEHDDYVGNVSLETGMTNDEFNDRAFHGIITEEDADRVWNSVQDAIVTMMELEDDDE